MLKSNQNSLLNTNNSLKDQQSHYQSTSKFITRQKQMLSKNNNFTPNEGTPQEVSHVSTITIDDPAP